MEAEGLIQTPNGTFITREQAEASGLVLPKPKAARKAATRKPAARKAATTRKGKA